MAEKRTYEIMYIAAPETADEDVTKLNESLQQIIENGGGSIVKTDVMGRRKLAYPINKKTEGYYTLFEIEGSGQEIAELERRMRVNDAIIRYLTVRVDEERKTAAKLTAKRENRQNRQRSGSSKFNQTEASAREEAQDNQ
ncbi:MAG TPA: 30S ribosomal protein S6 [Pyrinomonadaceae bacterium]|nr:30S ribosomal protein S6 [Pyrinomonadaceae bacterium]